MPRDFENRHGRRPVQPPDAVAWTGSIAHGQAVKDFYVYPLARGARQRLCWINIEENPYAGETKRGSTGNIPA
jgi:hypothetical protein